MKLVIKNGHVMDPASGRDEVTDIWVEDKRIIGFGEHPEWEEDIFHGSVQDAFRLKI